MLSTSLAETTDSWPSEAKSAIFLRMSSPSSPSERPEQHVGLDADAPQLVDRVLRGLRLELARVADVGHQRQVDVHALAPADVDRELADGLEERQRLDVAHRAADLGDDDVDVARLGDQADALLDLVGDVRDDLDGAAEVVAAALAPDDRVVDAAGGDVRRARGVRVREALVVTEVEIGLGAVLGDEDLAVLVRRHRAGIDVDVRVELLEADGESAGHEEAADRGGGDALPQRRDHAAGHEDVSRLRQDGSFRSLGHGERWVAPRQGSGPRGHLVARSPGVGRRHA